MTPAHSCKDGRKRYRYYTCTSAQKRGWHTCPSKSIPAGEIERFVVQQLRTHATTLPLQGDSVAAPVPTIDWDALTGPEQTRAVRRLVERVDYDGAAKTVSIRFRPTALPTAPDVAPHEESNP
jgi:Recombinase zinc beta ribbon domain